MNRHFVTYLDSKYAARGLVMIESLQRWSPGVRVTVLCLDEATARILDQELGDSVITVSLATLAQFEPRLVAIRASRTPWEFYATQKPVLLKWALERSSSNELAAFVDADTWFFADPEPAFAEAAGASVALSPHRFNEETNHLAIYGIYNAGFGLWRNDDTGRKCLSDWTEQCLNWCHEQPDEQGRFMNQGYLNEWPVRYGRVRELAHPGLNLAPWNVGSHELKRSPSGPLVDGSALIFFHFSSLHRSAEGQWWTIDLGGAALRQDVIQKDVYQPYLAALDAASARLLARYQLPGLGTVREADPNVPVLRLAI